MLRDEPARTDVATSVCWDLLYPVRVVPQMDSSSKCYSTYSFKWKAQTVVVRFLNVDFFITTVI